MPEKTTKKQSHGFQRGQSGNPKGRPKGARNKTTIAVEKLIGDEAAALTRVAITAALGGDMQAVKICLDRIAPAPKSRAVALDLPEMKNATDIAAALRAIMDAAANGDVSVDEAATLAAIADKARAAYETEELEARISAIEEATK